MTSKPETVLLQIQKLENHNHCKSFLEFYNWLTDDEDSSVRNATNYMMILRLFSVDNFNTDLKDITRVDYTVQNTELRWKQILGNERLGKYSKFVLPVGAIQSCNQRFARIIRYMKNYFIIWDSLTKIEN